MPLPPYSDFQKNCIGIFDILIREENWTGDWADRMNLLYNSLSQLMWETYPGSTFAQFCTAARRSGLSSINPVDFLDFMWSHLEYAELYIDPFDQSFRPRTSPADVNWENARIAAGRKVASLTVGDRKYKWGSGPGNSDLQYGYVTDLSDVVIPANNYDWLSRDAPYYRIVSDKNPVYPGESWTTTVSRTRPEIDPVIYIEETDDETQFVDETTQVVITFDTGELERQFTRVVKPSVTTPGRSYLRVTTRDYYDNGGNLERGLETIVTTELPPVANFTVSTSTVSVGQTVQFTDLSTNTPTSWAWDFDNSGSVDSTAQNPTHVFSGVGTYTVKLTVTNAQGSSTVTQTVTVLSFLGVGSMLTFDQDSQSVSSQFVSGDIACVYLADRNLIQYGLVESYTYTGNPNYSVSLRIRYIPRLPRSGLRQEELYSLRKGLIGSTTSSFMSGTTVLSAFNSMGVSNISAQPGSVVTFTDSLSASTSSVWSTGTVVSALIPNLNAIVLGRIKRITYTGTTGTVGGGSFRYYIESWNRGPSGPILRTYSCAEQYVASSTTQLASLISLGVVPPAKPRTYNIQITPVFIENINDGGTLSATLRATGGFPPYTWSTSTITAPEIDPPKTISITASGSGTVATLSSTPLNISSGFSGTSTNAEFTISVSDNDGNQASRLYSVRVGVNETVTFDQYNDISQAG